MKKRIGSIVLLLLVAGFVYMLYDYLSYRHTNAVSDAAFVKSDAIYTLGFKVGGKIEKMKFVEGERVHKNSTLATIDTADFIFEKERIHHSILALKANLESLQQKRERIFQELGIKTDISKNNIGVSDEKLQSLHYKIKAAKAKLAKVAKDKKRFAKLYRQKLISKTDYEKLQTEYQTLLDEINSAQKELNSFAKSTYNVKSAYKISALEQNRIKELDLSITALTEQIKANQKRLEALEKKIDYCQLKSPIDAIIAKKFVSNGRVVAKGTPIYSIVDPDNKHVEVLLSEKKLNGVKAGNSVTITTEALDKKPLKGIVETILPTSASTFSLVPRDIASGEFTKLDQRFTVRIKFEEPQDVLQHIYIGMGATVAIARSN